MHGGKDNNSNSLVKNDNSINLPKKTKSTMKYNHEYVSKVTYIYDSVRKYRNHI